LAALVFSGADAAKKRCIKTAGDEPAVFCYHSYNIGMKTKTGFSKEALATIDKERILGIHAGGDSTHKVIGIWAVVVDGRVFVRSYKLKKGGWWGTLVKNPQGEIFPAKRKRGIKIRAVQVKSEKMKDLVSKAYKEKYNTPGSVGYVSEMSFSPSRDATIEFVAE
jgi:hypothetical protein